MPPLQPNEPQITPQTLNLNPNLPTTTIPNGTREANSTPLTQETHHDMRTPPATPAIQMTPLMQSAPMTTEPQQTTLHDKVQEQAP